MKARVAARGQVTIPKVLRKKLGIQAGTVLEFSVKEKYLLAIKQDVQDNVSKVFGCLKIKRGTDRLLKELRGDI